MNVAKDDHYLKKELYELIKTDDSIFDFIQKSSLDGMWYWDIENPQNEWLNEEFWQVLGYDPKEMPHKSAAWQDIIFPDDLIMVNENYNKHLADSNYPFDQIVRYRHKDGHTVWVRCRGKAIRNEDGRAVRMLGAHNELTKFKKAEVRLLEANRETEKSKANIEAIIENTDDSIWAIDTDYKLTFANNRLRLAFEQAFGESLKVGEKILDKLPEALQPLWLERYKKVLGGEKFVVEDKVDLSDDSSIYIETAFNPIISDNKIIGASLFGKDITDDKLKQEELIRAKIETERSNERLEMALSATSDGLLEWDLVKDELFFSPRWKEIIGYRDDELPNVLDSWTENTVTEDVERAFELLEKNKKEQISEFRIQIRMKHKKGHYIDILVRANLFFDEKGILLKIVGTHADITESNKATLKIEENELKFRKLIDNMPSGVAIYEAVNEGEDFRFININKKAEEITNTENKELLGKTLLKRFPNMSKSPLVKNLRHVYNTGDNIYIPPFFYKDSKRDGWRENYIYKLKTGEVVAIFKDVTELKEAEERLRAQNIELKEAKEKAEESNRLKTEFINNMSHEIRTPMNGIMGFSKLLGKNELPEEKKNYYISIVNNSGKQLLRIIDDIIEISQLNTQKLKPVITEVCLNDVLLELFSVFDNKAKDNNTPLYLIKPLSDEESVIKSDESKLKKVLSNLLENAIKYTNKGNIELGYALEGYEITLYVKDTGIGIPKAKQKLIFERFLRNDVDLAKNIGGLGLGLSIAKENTELLGGIIECESEIGVGSTFRVKLPYGSANNRTASANINDQTKVHIPTVLIAEDEEINYLYIDTLINEQIELNCKTLHAKNGKVAVSICNDNPEISLVLMDIKMPEMDGYEATREIKKVHGKLPIVAQTAYSTSEDRDKAFSAGCDDFISKPIEQEKLESILKKYLNV